MSESRPGPLWFVVTGNHGSLIDVMVFLHGTDLLERSVLLLPPDLYDTHAAALPLKSHRYNSFSELVHWMDVDQPSLAFLSSGYMLITLGVMSPGELERFVALLSARGCPIVTNEPCWGLAATTLPMRSELPARTLKEKLLKKWVEWMVPRRLRRSYRILRDVVHCYPTSVQAVLPAQGLRTAEYFNPRLVASPAGANGWRRPMTQPFWLFILASNDYNIQLARHGRDAFTESLVGLLRRANDEGCRAVVIAPDSCLAAVRQQASRLGDVELVGYCDYQRYVSLLMFAEYAFYWNVASSSSFYRLVNGLPVIYFDLGHTCRWFPGAYERIVALLYYGHAPTVLDHRESLDRGRLRALAEAYRRTAEEIVRHYRKLPTPEELTARLLADAPAPRS